MKARVRVALAVLALGASGARAERCPVPAAWFDSYFAARREDRVVPAAVGLAKISRQLLPDPKSARTPSLLAAGQYRACLHWIQTRVADEPEAALDLARALQLRWEVLYWTPTARAARLRFEERCRKGGLSVGALAWGVTLWRRPQDVPKYFRYVRHFLPLAGWSLGHEVAVDSRPWTPDAPASIWRLPQVPSADEVESRRDTEELLAMASGITTSAVSYEVLAAIPVLRAANLACTPLKIHPGVFLGSLVLGFAAEEGVKATAALYDEWDARRALENGRRELAASLARRDDWGAFRASERIVEGTLRLVYRELSTEDPHASARVKALLDSSAATLFAAHREYLEPSIDYLRAFAVRWEAL